jgi:glyoxylase-like metal-dependent hydrolase (beta-lactamase superfamily II)
MRASFCRPAFGAILFFVIATAAPLRLLGDSAGTKGREATKLAEGVYEIRHPNAPDHFPQGNTVVIIGDANVLVVDSCYLPSSAREDIVQIRQWTTKPVRYLLNTHWHGDHNQGNAAYADAFASLAIIAQTETARLIALRVPPYLAEYPHRLERFQRRLEQIKTAVAQRVDVKAWRQKFVADDPNESDFFDSFAWPGLIQAALAEMWPR